MYLEEKIFSPYFNANLQNIVTFWYRTVELNCCDKRMKWIIVNNQTNRVRYAKCENNTYFHEMTLDDFDKCPHPLTESNDSIRCSLTKILIMFVSIIYFNQNNK